MSLSKTHLNWIEAGSIRYTQATIARNNVVNLDNLTVDPRYYVEESPRRWYFVIDAGGQYIFQVISMAYDSGWDSWDKYGEALRKYMNGEVEILLQKIVNDFNPDTFNPERILND